MRYPDGWEKWAFWAVLGGVGLWCLTSGGPKQAWDAGDEDTGPAWAQFPQALPSEYFHWSPVTWAGRKKAYPANWCGRLPGLIDKQPYPDYADRDS